MALRHLADAAARFSGDRRGNFAVMMALVCSVVVLAAGYGVNIAQLFMTRSNLLNALDAAVTSTARDLTTGHILEKDARPTVEAFLLANGGTGFAAADDISLDSLVVDKARGTVSAEASILVDLAFPLFGTADRQKVAVRSASLYSDKKIEVAMMLDVTGSMSGQKIRDLKAAATNAVNALLQGQGKTDPRVRVALVPYAEAVNAGRLASDVVFIEKAGGSNLPPPIDATRKEIRANTGAWEDNCATERKLMDGSADFSDDGPFSERLNDQRRRYIARINRDDRLEVCPRAAIEPLTADADVLKETIRDFSASGVTAGGIGVQWAYYMLSSKWRSVIKGAGLGEGPADFDKKKVAKIAILMTDGQFNTAFAGRGANQGDKSRKNAEGLCGAMKEDGIEIFTIGFDLNSRDMQPWEQEQAKAVLRNCASPDVSSIKHYYEASTGEELDAAYQEIIRNTERLYLTM